MTPFEHFNANTLDEAFPLLGPDWNTRIIAGGTAFVPEMKLGFITPTRIVNIKEIKELETIAYSPGQGLRIGAVARLNDIQKYEQVSSKFNILYQAICQTASPQIRNMATIGGNLCQPPRCWYYRNSLFHCLRKGGQSCYAVAGENKYHAILGGNRCFIVHPSDLAPALIALDAQVKILDKNGETVLPLEVFFIGPKVNLYRENILQPEQILTEVHIPEPPENAFGIYLKASDRKAVDFATVSVAVQITFDEAIVQKARIVLGGVAPIPWRCEAAEECLVENEISDNLISHIAALAVDGSSPLTQNKYKVELVQKLLRKGLLVFKGAKGKEG